ATARRHGVTLPNEATLEHFRYRFESEKPLPPTDEAGYLDAIIKSAGQVVRQRRGVISRLLGAWFFPPPADLIVALPAIFRHQYTGSAPWKRHHDPESKRLRIVLDAFARQSSYKVDIPVDI